LNSKTSGKRKTGYNGVKLSERSIVDEKGIKDSWKEFILLQKIQKMANKDIIFEYHPIGTSTCLHKLKVGKPSQNAAQPCAQPMLRHRVVLMMT